MKHEVFSRFKYAEQYASGLDANPKVSRWVMYRDRDRTYVEDEETYVIPTYIVEWWEKP